MKKLLLIALLLIGAVGYFIYNGEILSGVDYSAATSSLNNTLLVGTDATYPPMENMDENGEFVGFDMDLAREIAKEMGVNVKIVNIGWDDLFGAVEEGEVDVAMSSISITPERAKRMLFSNPYINAGQVAIVQADAVFGDVEDLQRSVIAAQKETTSEEEAKKLSDEIISYEDDYNKVLVQIKSREIDALIIDFVAGADIVKNNKELVMLGDPFTSEFYGIATRLENTDLNDGINKALATLKINGKMDKMNEIWFQN